MKIDPRCRLRHIRGSCDRNGEILVGDQRIWRYLDRLNSWLRPSRISNTEPNYQAQSRTKFSKTKSDRCPGRDRRQGKTGGQRSANGLFATLILVRSSD